MIVEYEGTAYNGFQYQAGSPSIQEEVERAIARFTGAEVRVKAAGRTDSGVHARGQVIAFDTASRQPPETFVRALNAYLPGEIAVKAAYRVGETFDPRREAISRSYRYTILNSPVPSPLLRRTTLMVAGPLNMRKMQKAAGMLVGRHDFARFSGPLEDPKGSTVRRIFDASVDRDDVIVTFDVEGNAFLPRQMRRMAGSLVDVGRGKLLLDEFRQMLDGGCGEAVAHALPAHGLCLMKVRYADFPPQDGEAGGDQYQAVPDPGIRS